MSTMSSQRNNAAPSTASSAPELALQPAALPRARDWLGGANKAVPTATVILSLAALAVWGHSTDWTLPKFSAMFGGAAAETDGWCKEHNVPESQCIECNKNLLPGIPDYGWCQEHGVAQCPLHNPEVAQLRLTPIVSGADFDRANRALALLPREENNSHCVLYERRIQFASAEAVEKAGVDIAVVDERPLSEAIVANGE